MQRLKIAREEWSVRAYLVRTDPLLFKDPQVQEYLTELWQPLQNPDDWSIQKHLQTWAQQLQYLQGRQREKTCESQQLEDLERQLALLHEDNDLSPEYTAKIHQLTERIKHIRAWRHHCAFLCSRVHSLREGQASTAYFHKLFRRRQAAAKFRLLKTEQGQTLKDPYLIMQEFHSYYRQLYQGYDMHDDNIRSLIRVLDQVQPSLQASQRAFLDDEPSDQEIVEVAHLLPKNKAPGLDALSADALTGGHHLSAWYRPYTRESRRQSMQTEYFQPPFQLTGAFDRAAL
ncbi:hypothetical protein R1sor_015911 [Riccia sorocarpa]|uniref:Uncharacterized protein n=1 Tax=Riccia sorocarpa TaxID=122646 RepID=A0ABD3HG99_9MARC